MVWLGLLPWDGCPGRGTAVSKTATSTQTTASGAVFSFCYIHFGIIVHSVCVLASSTRHINCKNLSTVLDCLSVHCIYLQFLGNCADYPWKGTLLLRS